MQLDEARRGFSFRREGPSTCAWARRPTAADIVATASVEELTRIFREWGEERMAAKIARGIVRERPGPIQHDPTARPHRRGGERGPREDRPGHRVFQALRIEVNQELTALARFLAAAVARLERGGRLAVISYHSLEDRIVKDAFRRDRACACAPRGCRSASAARAPRCGC
jgi:16S rRNA (cytosine1402-N4)-methyltransferase